MIITRLFKAELLKTKKMPILWFYAALIIVSIGTFFLFFYFLTFEEFSSVRFEENPNPWYAYYFSRYLFLWVFLLPLIVSITTYIIKNIEDKADAWKRLFVLPYDRAIIHVSKLSLILLYTTSYVLITFLILVLSGISLSELKPDFDFQAHQTYHEFLPVFWLKFEISVIAITTFSYAYMILVKRTVVSLLLSIFLPFVGLFFTSQYSSPLYQLHTFHGMRAEMVINSKSYDTLHLNVIGSHDILCLIIIVLSFIAIILASKRPIINYE
jgi:hypothetical protein